MSNILRIVTRRVLALALFGCGAVSVANAQQNYNPVHVIGQMKLVFPQSGGPKLNVIAAHRGIYKAINGCPENSTCSIPQTYNNNIEAIELDVRLSGNGTPWLFHDYNLGRVTNINYNGQYYSPFTNGGPNPGVANTSDYIISSYALRDSNFNVTGYYTCTLARALQLIKNSYPHMAVLLDVKNASEATAADAVVKANGMTGYVAIKSNWSAFTNPNNYASWIVPVFGANDLPNIFNAQGGGVPGKSAQDVVNTYLANKATASNFLYYEVRLKDYGVGPVAPAYNFVRARYGVGSYSVGGDYNGQLYEANGQCCVSLSNYYYSNASWGTEQNDYRGRGDFQADYFTTTISDYPVNQANYSASVGRRATGPLY
jgi:glycerophosphoryl diester phosphodiesterase